MAATGGLTVTGWQGRIPLIVGVAGHRQLDPNELADLGGRARDFFEGLRKELPATPIVVLSRLAGASDQLVASAALAVGCQLACVMSGESGAHRATFASDVARDTLDRLLAASVRVRLPAGEAEATDPEQAYADAGYYLARHSTLLLAVWDGVESHRPGSVAEVLRWRSMSWIGPADPTVFRLCARRGQAAGVLLDTAATTSAARAAIEACGWRNAERFNTAILAAARPELAATPEPFSAVPDERVAEVAAVARAASLSAASMRTILSRRRILLQSIAFCAAISFAVYLKLGAHDWVLWIYLGLLASAVSVRTLMRRQDLHHRYLDYRSLAEGLRVLLYWRIAGVLGDITVSRPDASFGWIGGAISALDGWMGREPLAGLNGCEFAARHWLGAGRDDDPHAQIPYYRAAASHLRRLAGRVDRIVSFTLFTGVVSAALLAVLPAAWGLPARPILTTVMGLMPLVSGTASAAIDAPAEREMARQYEHMERLLENAARRLAVAESDEERRRILFEAGSAALAEQRIWHAVFGQRTPEGRLRA